MVYRVATLGGGGTVYAMRCPAQEKLEDILLSLKEKGVQRIVSLLEPAEAEKLGVGAEPALCKQLGLTYQNYPIKDFATAENQTKFANFTRDLYGILLDGENVVVHCYAGIGRTGLTIGSVLILDGMPAKEAIELMSDARGRNMPQTQEQYEYLIDFEGEAMALKSNPREKEKKVVAKAGWWKRLFS